VFGSLQAEDRAWKLLRKPAFPFVHAWIKIDGEEIPLETLGKEGESVIVTAGKRVQVVRMEVKVEEL
jgi:hypothetical protein